MKLLCTNTNNCHPDSIQVGNEYDLKERWKGCYSVEINGIEYYCSLSNFEGPKDRLIRLAQTSSKVISSKPGTGTTVEILATENYLVVYSHTKGNHWNICGNHYKYYHDFNTGEFISECDVKNENVLIKERLLMADFKKLHSIIMAKHMAVN